MLLHKWDSLLGEFNNGGDFSLGNGGADVVWTFNLFARNVVGVAIRCSSILGKVANVVEMVGITSYNEMSAKFPRTTTCECYGVKHTLLLAGALESNVCSCFFDIVPEFAQTKGTRSRPSSDTRSQSQEDRGCEN